MGRNTTKTISNKLHAAAGSMSGLCSNSSTEYGGGLHWYAGPRCLRLKGSYNSSDGPCIGQGPLTTRAVERPEIEGRGLIGEQRLLYGETYWKKRKPDAGIGPENPKEPIAATATATRQKQTSTSLKNVRLP